MHDKETKNHNDETLTETATMGAGGVFICDLRVANPAKCHLWAANPNGNWESELHLIVERHETFMRYNSHVFHSIRLSVNIIFLFAYKLQLEANFKSKKKTVSF